MRSFTNKSNYYAYLVFLMCQEFLILYFFDAYNFFIVVIKWILFLFNFTVKYRESEGLEQGHSVKELWCDDVNTDRPALENFI